jgi:hypothetical protein
LLPAETVVDIVAPEALALDVVPAVTGDPADARLRGMDACPERPIDTTGPARAAAASSAAL